MPLVYSAPKSNTQGIVSLKQQSHLTIGWKEWVALPDLNIKLLKAKIDSGAKTSVLHTFQIEPFKEGKKDRIRFWVHPLQRNISKEVQCEADIVDYRMVIDSGGHKEYRYVIQTRLSIEDSLFPIELSLTNRDGMRFRMLLGREAIKAHYLIDVSKAYLLDKPTIRTLKKIKTPRGEQS